MKKKKLAKLLVDLRSLINRDTKFEELLRRDRLECNFIIGEHIKINDKLRLELRQAREHIRLVTAKEGRLEAELKELKASRETPRRKPRRKR